jgi:TfoX/Sxy family transcriptional regulator of competence genes
MEWKKPSPELTAYLVATMKPFGAETKKMFGSTCFFAGGNMFTGVHEDHIFLRLGEKERLEAISSFKDAAPFEPIKGRPMKEYVIIPPALYNDADVFKAWIGRSMEYAKTIPPKASKVKKK